MEKLKLLEWNINGRSIVNNYSLPSFIHSAIAKANPDVIVLTEFVKVPSAINLIKRLSEHYAVFLDKKVQKGNQILLALKKNSALNWRGTKHFSLSSSEEDLPNFLGVETKWQRKKLIICGARIRIGGQEPELDGKSRFAEFKTLFDNIAKKDTVIVGGDFNNYYKRENLGDYQNGAKYYNYQKIVAYADEKGFTISKPAGYSWGASKKSTNGYVSDDHFFIKGLQFADQQVYDWNFRILNSETKAEYYNEDGSLKECSETQLPDHAMLLSKIKL
ncbi:hypothetical protein PT285_06635 [Lactobacillus sp. ESL0791]|uniref:hypothetical protein n=1 Tax=Lactobacillus sp. ESL0791 TaxID=2983234 RepID=UPI0023F6C09C|nr:hypothetical protein [Lactobacillus sp. ESL0791]MDF7639076.1 hypothetical protein [Lactobacillus sp. ESL0791]